MRHYSTLCLLASFYATGAFAQSPSEDGNLADVFRQRVHAFDDEFKALLGSPDMLNAEGHVVRNLTSAQSEQVQGMFRRTLGIDILREDAGLFGNRMVQVARKAGKDWRRTISISELYRTDKGSHGFIAEMIDFDQVYRKYPTKSYRVEYTSPRSMSTDLLVFDRNTDRLVECIQTKVRAQPTVTLREGIKNAQQFYVDKNFESRFVVDIPKDHFNELVKKGVVASDGKVFDPDRFAKMLDRNVEAAVASDSAIPGSKTALLKEIPKRHGSVSVFNKKVLGRVEIRPLDATYEEIKAIQDETDQLHSKIVRKSAHRAYLDGMPSDFQLAVNAASVAAAFKAMDVLWREGLSEESAEMAVTEASKIAGRSFTSTYSASGIMRRVGDKVLFTTPVSWVDPTLVATDIAGKAFLATFLFDETGTIVSFALGEQTGQEFSFETGRNLFYASPGSAVIWGTIWLGAAPNGLVVAAVAIGARVFVAKAFETVELYHDRQHVSLRDFIGRLPVALRNRITPFDQLRESVLEVGVQRDSVFEIGPQRRSVFEVTPQRKSVFEVLP